jgi:hypothetical protein
VVDCSGFENQRGFTGRSRDTPSLHHTSPLEHVKEPKTGTRHTHLRALHNNTQVHVQLLDTCPVCSGTCIFYCKSSMVAIDLSKDIQLQMRHWPGPHTRGLRCQQRSTYVHDTHVFRQCSTHADQHTVSSV